MSSDYQLEDTLYLPFTTRAFATGIPTALVSGVVDIYEDVTATPIITAETLTVSLNSHAGFNMITVTATAASGFEAGKSYTALLDAGTVDSVSVVGEVVAHFTLDKSGAAKDLANATDGLGALSTDIATAQTDLDTITGAAGAIIDDSAANDTTISDAVWDEDATGHQTAGTFGEALGDPAATGESIRQLVGEFDAAAAAGDPSTTESAMQYLKQIVNILAGAAGVATFPTAAAPANAVSIAEVLRALYDALALPLKNTALANVPIQMVLSSDSKSPATGLSPVLTRDIDGGGFAAKDAGTTITESGSTGLYIVDLAAADTNGNIITYKLAVATADDSELTIRFRDV